MLDSNRCFITYFRVHKQCYCDIVDTYLSLIDGDPVCLREPLVVLYVIHTILQVAKSLCQVYLQQVSQQILQVGAKVRRKSYLQEPSTINTRHVIRPF